MSAYIGPAFYARGGSILWVVGGSVVNGGWRPTFSDDGKTCWSDPRDPLFEWAGRAPFSGNYNDVIGKFAESMGKVGYWVRRRRVQVRKDADIVTLVASLAHYVAEDGSLVVSPSDARRYPDMYEATIQLDGADTIEFVLEVQS